MPAPEIAEAIGRHLNGPPGPCPPKNSAACSGPCSAPTCALLAPLPRNRHRCGIAWAHSAVRAILSNPHYTGRQVWKKQAKFEVLLNVYDVALGHATKLKWNEPGQWIWSKEPVHEPLEVQPANGRRAVRLAGTRFAASCAIRLTLTYHLQEK